MNATASPRRRSLRRLITALALFGAAALPAAAQAAPPARFAISELLGPPQPGNVRRPALPLRILADNAIVGQLDSGLQDDADRPIYHAFHQKNNFTTFFIFGSETEPDQAAALDGNSAGNVVGQHNAPGSTVTHAFLVDVQDGFVLDLPDLIGESTRSRANAINESGMVVGMVDDHAFVWSQAGGKIDLGPGEALDINNQGEVVGFLSDNPSTPFYFKDANGNNAVDQGELVPLGTLGGSLYNRASAINENGVIIGRCSDPVGGENAVIHGVRWTSHEENAAPSNLGSLPNQSGDPSSTFPLGINDQGQIVGSSNLKPFLWENGEMIDLRTQVPANSTWVFTSVASINNSGRIVGSATRTNGGSTPRGFLLTPNFVLPDIQSLTVNPTTTRTGRKVKVTITLTAKTRNATTIPFTVQLGNGTPVTFNINVGKKKRVSTKEIKTGIFAPGVYTLSATYRGVTKTATLTLTP